ncbi:hypothetical protein B0H14DRAFT_2629164 [Mycena olivaceomarginata]|nr:hypothetical protein B0H14DRAFT_2629164 [Mycena olivaceomarginata]
MAEVRTKNIPNPESGGSAAVCRRWCRRACRSATGKQYAGENMYSGEFDVSLLTIGFWEPTRVLGGADKINQIITRYACAALRLRDKNENGYLKLEQLTAVRRILCTAMTPRASRSLQALLRGLLAVWPIRWRPFCLAAFVTSMFLHGVKELVLSEPELRKDAALGEEGRLGVGEVKQDDKLVYQKNLIAIIKKFYQHYSHAFRDDAETAVGTPSIVGPNADTI